MPAQARPRQPIGLVICVGLVFLLACTVSITAQAAVHHAGELCQDTKDGCLSSDKFQSLPAITTPHEPSGDVPVERASLPQQEPPRSRDLWQPFLSRSPPQA